MTQETERRRGDYGFDVVIACLNAVIVALICWPAWNHWRHGEIDNSFKEIGIVPILISVSLFKLSRFCNSILAKDIVAFVCACFALITAYWMNPSPILLGLLLVLFFLLVAWRVTFHLRGWRLNRKISRNLSRIESLTRGPRAGTSCKRLSPNAILRFTAVFLILLLLMVLRYWRVGDRVSSIALAVVFLYVGVNTVLRLLKRRQTPGEVKEFRDRHMYAFLVISAFYAAIFGFVAIRSWQRDGSLFWSGLCWTVALADAFFGTFVVVMYFCFRKRAGAITTQTSQLS